MKGTIFIAGAGIGGMALAASLKRVGLDVHVFERAAALGLVGAGLTLQSNAVAALRQIGLDDAVLAEGQRVGVGLVRSPSGAVLQSASMTALAQEAGAPSAGIHRARLHAVLAREVGEESLHLGHAVTGYREDDGGVTLMREGADELRGDVLIGADGLRSAVRAQLLGDGEPRYAGYTSWRGVCRASYLAPPEQTSETWGVGRRFGIVPLGHGEIYWFATENAPPGGRDETDPRPALLRRFGDWHHPVRALVESTNPDDIVRTDIRDRPPAARWSSGRVALLGDAAHPMTPNLGQGGCQAIEDAVVLGDCLQRHEHPRAAFAEYERRRMKRANWIVESARRFGALTQHEGALVRLLRDTAMRLIPEALARKQMLEMLRLPR